MSSGTYKVLAATVEYGDLDLSTNEGAAALFGRIENASAAVCGNKPGRVLSGAAARQ